MRRIQGVVPTLYVASLQTTHFFFEGVGMTAREAKAGLRLALGKHGAQLRLRPQWWRDLVGDVQVRSYAAGAQLRDGSPIPDPPPPRKRIKVAPKD